MNHGREKREERSEREERETKILKRAVGKYKMVFFFFIFIFIFIFFFIQSSYNELVLIQAHNSCVSKILSSEIFDGVVFFCVLMVKFSIYHF